MTKSHFLSLVPRTIVSFHRFGGFPSHDNLPFRSSSGNSKHREVGDTQDSKKLNTENAVHLTLMLCLAQAFRRSLILNKNERKIEPSAVVILDRERRGFGKLSVIAGHK
jgi:hypothetical protein